MGIRGNGRKRMSEIISLSFKVRMLLISLDPESEVVDLALARVLTYRLCRLEVAWGFIVLIRLELLKSV